MADLDTRKLDIYINGGVTRAAKRWLRSVANRMNEEIVGSFDTSPPGRAYLRPGGRIHIASVAGYPPNIDTGALSRSMHVEEVDDLTLKISDGVDYGIYLEMGTSKMEARPFVSPVFARWRGKIEDDARANGILAEVR